MTDRPRLTPQMADVRRAVRETLASVNPGPNELVLAAVSGGGDSLALAAALAFEAPRLNLRAGAVVVDHQLQKGSEEVAARAVKTLTELGLERVEMRKVEVQNSGLGLEGSARDARYQALEEVRHQLAASWVLLGHNLEDQAESVLLGLTRGSGLKSIAGMERVDRERRLVRPLLGISRAELRQACQDQGIEYWDDPHNSDQSFKRVRIRTLMQTMESELGPGLPGALSRTAEIASESEEFLTAEARKVMEKAKGKGSARSVSYEVSALAEAHLAVRNKALFLIAQGVGAQDISRAQVLGVEELISNWHGQKMVQLSGITVERVGDQLVFKSTKSLTPGAC